LAVPPPSVAIKPVLLPPGGVIPAGYVLTGTAGVKEVGAEPSIVIVNGAEPPKGPAAPAILPRRYK
jgi:hypothetical protein